MESRLEEKKEKENSFQQNNFAAFFRLYGRVEMRGSLSLLYLMPISFHDQCPSSTSACANAVAGHVTIHWSISTASPQQVGFIDSRADE